MVDMVQGDYSQLCPLALCVPHPPHLLWLPEVTDSLDLTVRLFLSYLAPSKFLQSSQLANFRESRISPTFCFLERHVNSSPFQARIYKLCG